MTSFLNTRQSIFGALIAIGSIIPLYGRVFGVPSVTLSAVFLIAATLAIPGRSERKIKDLAPGFIVMGLFAAYAVLVAFSTFAEQWTYFFTPLKWLHHADDYVGSKLIMFVVSAVPAVYAGTLFAIFSDSKGASREGLMLGFVAVATAAAVRAFVDAFPLLAATDYETARIFFMNLDRPYSTVSYGILFVIGGACSVTHRRLWPLTALFLFMSAWLSRKTETTLILMFVLSYAFYSAAIFRDLRSAAIKTAIVVGLAVAAFIPLHNQANINTWLYLSDNIDHRMAILENQKWDDATSSIVADQIAQRLSAENHGVPVQGLGSFAMYSVNKTIPYPHNILVETYQEIGPIAAAIVLAIFLLSVSLAAYEAIMMRRPDVVPLLFACGSVFIIAMKAGDITNVGRITLFCILCTTSAATPQILPRGVRSPPSPKGLTLRRDAP